MAAFSFQPTREFSLDSIFMPKNTTTNTSNYLGDESNINNMNSTLSQVYHPQVCVRDVSLRSNVQESSCLDHNYNSKATHAAAACSDNDPSVTKKQFTESDSSVVDMLEKGEQVTQRVNSMDKKRKSKYLSSLSSAQSKGNKEERCKKQKKIKGVKKNEQEEKPKADKKVEVKKAGVEPPAGYIHVRARRGQATDSHSLAERVRREKISERMKVLQSLVPGCEKVTGKALVLDEIINYVQSLQNQVEFLSMKLSSTNPLFFDFGMDLDAFTLDSERVNSMHILPQCSPTQPISTTFTNSTTTSSYPLLESSSLLLHQGKVPHANSLNQDGGSLAWDVLDQRQKFLNPFGFPNNLCSFL